MHCSQLKGSCVSLTKRAPRRRRNVQSQSHSHHGKSTKGNERSNSDPIQPPRPAPKNEYTISKLKCMVNGKAPNSNLCPLPCYTSIIEPRLLHRYLHPVARLHPGPQPRNPLCLVRKSFSMCTSSRHSPRRFGWRCSARASQPAKE